MDQDRLFATLDRVALRTEILAVRHGACTTGADRLAGEWAGSRGYTVQAFPAQWEQFGKSAGPRRNLEMIRTEPIPVCAVAFPGGRGTADMIRNIEHAGIPLWRVR